MRKKLQTLLLGAMMGILTAGCSIFGKSGVEEASYKVITEDGNKQIRNYSGHIIAKTSITGDFKDAQSKGFNTLAGYIFGKNKSKQKVSMTAPVVMGPSDNQTWIMTFTMPSKHTLETLPEPTDKRVQLEKVEEKLVGAITYSGVWSETKNQEMAQELTHWLKNHPEYELTSAPMFAGYNPPWTLPPFRRNEMLIELKRK
jgi:hypothetical protein